MNIILPGLRGPSVNLNSFYFISQKRRSCKEREKRTINSSSSVILAGDLLLFAELISVLSTNGFRGLFVGGGVEGNP